MIEDDVLPHRRRNPLTDEWILCSPHRATRPWQGQHEAVAVSKRPAHDSSCYLCPGNQRVGGQKNPDYLTPYVFENDFQALLDGVSGRHTPPHPLLSRQPVLGKCLVVCFSPRHDLTLAEMPLSDIEQVIGIWVEQSQELEQRYRWVQIFENKGAVMGCSNPHPHGQIWAMNEVPTLPAKEDRCQADYFTTHGRALLADYAELEIEQVKRVVCLNDDWVVVVPYWATWPFETLLLPRFPLSRLSALPSEKFPSLARIYKELLVRYDNLFRCEHPYSMGWHSAPAGEDNAVHWQAHVHFSPPLLRSASVKKFMVGFELMAEAQRDITPESAAARLREMPTTRFTS